MQGISQEIFRAYDIRGIVGEQITAAVFERLGNAFGRMMQQEKQNSLAVGYDGRHSSSQLADALVSGLVASGRHIIRIGRVPTPCLYHAVHRLKLGAGIMVTGSHNPPEYNGCKMMLNGRTLALEDIQRLFALCGEDMQSKPNGRDEDLDFLPQYIDDLVGDNRLRRPWRLVVDSGNGVTGECAPEIYRKLGAEVSELYCEVDGNFPNHHPDPGKLENLRDLQEAVGKQQADIGFAFDGDGDRLGLVTGAGQIIYADRMMMLFVRDLLQRIEGAKIVFDVKCSSLLPAFIKQHGGAPIMWKTGHSLIKRKMQETGALLGGEMSGHLFFAEAWSGADDALLAGVRLLQILDQSNKSIDELCNDLPDMQSTPEINVKVSEREKTQIINLLKERGEFEAQEIIDIDGLRVEYADGWGLARASNTSPVLVFRFEAKTKSALRRIIDVFQRELHKIRPDIDFFTEDVLRDL